MATQDDATGLKEIKDILVPIDYSDYSILACRYAIKIAKKSNGRITLFHTFYSPAYDLVELTGGIHTQQQLREDITEKLLDNEKEIAYEFISKLEAFSDFSKADKSLIKLELRPGIAKDEIINYCSVEKPDIVVMGTRGQSKKANSLFGSITENAIKKLKLPVLAIPENYEFIGEENLKQILFLTDFDESDFLSITKLMQFTKLFEMKIHCIHIGSNAGKWEELKMQGLQDYFSSTYHDEMVNCTILPKKGDLLEALDEYIINNKINLVSLTTRKRNLINQVFKPSITKKIFYHTNIPLLVFHS